MNTIAKFENKPQEFVESKPMSLHQKLVQLRKSVPSYLKKESENKHFGYKYVKESVVLGLVSEPMNDLGLILTQEITALEDFDYSALDKSGSSVSKRGVRAHLVYTWINASEPSEVLKLSQVMQDDKFDIKGCGGILTYGLRYFLMKFLNIATDESDPDSFGASIDKKREDELPATIDESQCRSIKRLIKISGADEKAFLKFLGCGCVEQMRTDQFITAVGKLSLKMETTSVASV